MRATRRLRTLGLATALVGINLAPGIPTHATTAHVLLVCNGSTTPCPAGGPYYTTIQAALSATVPGDWVLVWPGIYHETGAPQAGIYITTPSIHLRGMERDGVIVDGSLPGATGFCPSDPTAQNLTGGRNGIEVYKVDGTTVDNLTVCNYLSDGYGNGGNEIWWNGGDKSGLIGMHSYEGSFLTATSTYYITGSANLASYGIFISNADGPGSLSYSYAGNMADSSFYLGACQNCNAVLNHLHAQNSSLGYSGTNSGGNLVIENSEWDHNKVGIAPNSLNNDDAPPPQNGLCPNGAPGPFGTHSCTIIRGNNVHDNNNPNVPEVGISGEAPVGTGIELSGGQMDTVISNTVANQGAWGILTHDYPDTETPPPPSHCQGGIPLGKVCFFKAYGNQVSGNTLSHNGFFSNPTNSDLANESKDPLKNCFFGNTDPITLTSDPANIESSNVDGPPCNAAGPGDSAGLFVQAACDAGLIACPPGTTYPKQTAVHMMPLSNQPTMPNPCAGVPANPWCPSGRSISPRIALR